MKTFVFAVVICAAIGFSAAEDDGQYHPGFYSGDDGQYHPNVDSQYYAKYRVYNPLENGYNNLVGRSKYYNYGYQPVYYQQKVEPSIINYSEQNGIDQNYFASSLSGVTISPPVLSITPKVVAATAAPVVYSPVVYSSTPTPFVYSTPIQPKVVSATVKPFTYSSTIRPLVLSQQVPSVYKVAPTLYNYVANRDQSASLVKQQSEISNNAYHYAFTADNGINVEEQGSVDPSANGGGTRTRGFYEYVGDDGLKYRVEYIADENGYRASGAHLPRAA